MKAVLFKSLAFAAAFTAVPLVLAFIFAYTYEPTPDGNDSDPRGAGAFIYYAPSIFAFLAAFFFFVGTISHIIRSRRQG